MKKSYNVSINLGKVVFRVDNVSSEKKAVNEAFKKAGAMLVQSANAFKPPKICEVWEGCPPPEITTHQ